MREVVKIVWEQLFHPIVVVFGAVLMNYVNLTRWIVWMKIQRTRAATNILSSFL